MRVRVIPEESRLALRQPSWVKSTTIIRMHATGRRGGTAGNNRFPMSRQSLILKLPTAGTSQLKPRAARSDGSINRRPTTAKRAGLFGAVLVFVLTWYRL